ncbi:MAG TPA: hypothetical protein IGS52_04090 [Oscillatoriaceae cyanobacterium M33_DOE_052]|nr:hypothetical protein [Oscillatoriaceae cyanobacterium M33_DOE_052]
MSANEQARNLMMRHNQLVKNRQQSMLSRSAAEVGLDTTEIPVSRDRASGSMS